MIKINLLKEEKRKLSVPSLSGLKEMNLKDIAQQRAILVVPIIGALAVAGEIFYGMKLSEEVSSLESEVNKLTATRDKLKQKANDIAARKKEIQAQIQQVKNRIAIVEQSKGVILTLKNHYAPFNASLRRFIYNTPTSVWFNGFTQVSDISSIRVEINLSAYSVKTIEKFLTSVKSRYSKASLGSIERVSNDYGVFYYKSSIKAVKNIGERREM